LVPVKGDDVAPATVEVVHVLAREPSVLARVNEEPD
jgi:hypothetical protein